MLALGQLYSAMLLLLLSLLLGLWAFLVRDMMPFAAALISIAGLEDSGAERDTERCRERHRAEYDEAQLDCETVREMTVRTR